MISVLGASGPNRETITTGRVFAAKPRSASQISSGRGFAQDVRNVLLAGTGTGVDMSGEAVPRGNVSGIRTFLGASARPIAYRPQVTNLPHVVSTAWTGDVAATSNTPRSYFPARIRFRIRFASLPPGVARIRS